MAQTPTDSPAFALALATAFDLDRAEVSDDRPAHIATSVARHLDAAIVEPGGATPTRADRLLSRFWSTPEHWATARHLARHARPGDVVWCAGEDIGIPVALASARRRRLRVVMQVLNPSGRRPAAFLRLASLVRRQQLTIATVTPHTAANGRRVAPQARHVSLPHVIDTRFFHPDATDVAPDGAAPIIASGGRENRDYVTLADALADLPLDIRWCAVSPNASARQRIAIPDELPANVRNEALDFPQLRSLYRQAAVVVVSCLDNDISAGYTTAIEALACGTPVIVTRTPGLMEDLIEAGHAIGVPPADPAALREAVLAMLDDPAAGREAGARGRRWVEQTSAEPGYLDAIGTVLHEASSA